MGEYLSKEEIGHVDLVFVAGFGIGVGEDVGALEDLRAKAEDIVDYEYGAGGSGGACGVCG